MRIMAVILGRFHASVESGAVSLFGLRQARPRRHHRLLLNRPSCANQPKPVIILSAG
jgi:hypothetical protein